MAERKVRKRVSFSSGHHVREFQVLDESVEKGEVPDNILDTTNIYKKREIKITVCQPMHKDCADQENDDPLLTTSKSMKSLLDKSYAILNPSPSDDNERITNLNIIYEKPEMEGNVSQPMNQDAYQENDYSFITPINPSQSLFDKSHGINTWNCSDLSHSNDSTHNFVHNPVEHQQSLCQISLLPINTTFKIPNSSTDAKNLPEPQSFLFNNTLNISSMTHNNITPISLPQTPHTHYNNNHHLHTTPMRLEKIIQEISDSVCIANDDDDSVCTHSHSMSLAVAEAKASRSFSHKKLDTKWLKKVSRFLKRIDDFEKEMEVLGNEEEDEEEKEGGEEDEGKELYEKEVEELILKDMKLTFINPNAKPSGTCSHHNEYSTDGCVLLMKSHQKHALPAGFQAFDMLDHYRSFLYNLKTKPLFKSQEVKPPTRGPDPESFMNFDIEKFWKEDEEQECSLVTINNNDTTMNASDNSSSSNTASNYKAMSVNELKAYAEQLKTHFKNINFDD